MMMRFAPSNCSPPPSPMPQLKASGWRRSAPKASAILPLITVCRPSPRRSKFKAWLRSGIHYRYCGTRCCGYLSCRTRMDVNANLVRELRDKTGAGVMDCKNALAETKGDLEQAARWLREKGIAQAAKRAGRIASEGLVGAYIHAGGKLGVLVEINCESDFVAKTPEFQQLVKEIGMQVAAANPRYVSREEVPADVIEQERQIYAAQSADKPEAVVRKIVEGKLEKFYRDIVLEEQAWVRDPNRTIRELLGEYTGKLGEKIEIRRFSRFQLGENL